MSTFVINRTASLLNTWACQAKMRGDCAYVYRTSVRIFDRGDCCIRGEPCRRGVAGLFRNDHWSGWRERIRFTTNSLPNPVSRTINDVNFDLGATHQHGNEEVLFEKIYLTSPFTHFIISYYSLIIYCRHTCICCYRW